ncbi:transposase [Streptomyces sp. 2231.1]|uniref:transposase n=1 Tax=Streptomyces sp. 2231.1 TaxID=1855347 RepID=UPI000AE38632
MTEGQVHRRAHRPQRYRVQRAIGRRRWVIERTISWLSGYRRLSPRYERDPRNYLAFLGLAAAICCHKRLLNLTM